MKYLIIADKNSNNEWTASIFDDTHPLFRVLTELAQDTPTLTLENINVLSRGKVETEDFNSNISMLLRVIGFRKCTICGSWVTPQDVRSGRSVYYRDIDTRYCADCLSKNPHIKLNEYHSTNNQVRVINGRDENYTLDNVLGIGIECEYNSGCYPNGIMKCNKEFYEIASDNARNRIFRCERDCTVEGEIISNVFTKKSLYDFNWKILTDTLILNGNDEDIGEVGLHVHLSKLWLGATNKEQVLNFLKLQYFLKCYEEDFFKMSGRKRDEMDYCSFYERYQIENMKRNALSYINQGYNPWDTITSSHSYALIKSGATIELRIGKSTNDPEKIKHYLRFVLGITENIKNVAFEKCYCIGKVTKLVPSETMNYWRKNGCFLNTNAMDTRGITLE